MFRHSVAAVRGLVQHGSSALNYCPNHESSISLISFRPFNAVSLQMPRKQGVVSAGSRWLWRLATAPGLSMHRWGGGVLHS
ncbi:hypothetical protein K505DRAFT_327297 [Melanomma pulvis-pyrius CBS 109.77]|uniref:Uncharacterized protein n=1 Tax=Melanomma pulvis-pyrius CBS 109.77 TaxID=1314802 RepID=A0A6A6X3B4_9PLEO|nr:hypothetical protein K505DRAFT_327297 [Melanomma pulvis-pyrius CBS 109.77]